MKKTVFFGLLVVVLAFGFIGCSDDDDPYKLTWGLWEGATYSEISQNFSNADVPLTPVGNNAGYLTGNAAAEAFNIISNEFKFDDDGTKTGTYESLVDYKKDGIGAPSDLKTAMLAEKNNVPVGGVYYVTSVGVIVFYVAKN